MYFLRAFISGLILPALVLPFILILLVFCGKGEVVGDLSVHLLPWVWGLWNVLYFYCCRDFLPYQYDVRMLLTGAGLGILVALYGVFVLQLPELLGFSGVVYYLPLVVVPVVYALLWRYVVGFLNASFGLEDPS